MDRRTRQLSLSALAIATLSAGCTGEGRRSDTPFDPPPPVVIDRSLAWASTQDVLLDDATAVGLARVMAAFSADAHGGPLLEDWLDAFATTAHSQRYGPTLLADGWRTAYGTDAAQWDLDALPFRVTGVHNRIDLLSRDLATGHCGEFRVSLASTDPTYQPLHVIFLFRQPLGVDDVESGAVTCRGTAGRWAELSALEGAEFLDAAPMNPLLFQTVDIPRMNTPGAEHDGFLAWVETNAAALDARTIAIPDAYRSASARVVDGVPREILDLTGVSAGVLAQFPDLRKNVEIVGCPVCHTADADFVQTKPDRTFSPFYEKELDARKAFLDALAAGDDPVTPFAPLQPDPILPE